MINPPDVLCVLYDCGLLAVAVMVVWSMVQAARTIGDGV